MKWFAYNAFGAAAWLAGLLVAKGAGASSSNLLLTSGLPEVSMQSQIVTGACICCAGLVVLIWSNLRTPA